MELSRDDRCKRKEDFYETICMDLGKMNLDHVEKYAETLKEAGIDTGMVSPQLLPNYAGKRHL